MRKAVVVALILACAGSADASWMTIRNDTKQTVVVQETTLVNGQVRRGKPITLLPGESFREFLAGPTVKKIDVLDIQNANRPLWSGSLNCKDEAQTYSIAGSGGTIAVRPVAPVPRNPGGERK
jgi:hypothetical protein